MRKKLATLLRWLAEKVEPQKTIKVLTPFGLLEVSEENPLFPTAQNPRFSKPEPKAPEILFGYEDNPAIEKVAALLLGSEDSSDMEHALGWLTEITGSSKHAEANILLLTLLDRTKFEATITEGSSWKVWIETRWSQFNAGSTEVHVHGNLSFNGKEIFKFCRDMQEQEYNNGLAQQTFASHFREYYAERECPERLSFVAWDKFATVNALLRQ